MKPAEIGIYLLGVVIVIGAYVLTEVPLIKGTNAATGILLAAGGLASWLTTNSPFHAIRQRVINKAVKTGSVRPSAASTVGIVLLCGLLLGGCAELKPIARTALDIARAACEMFAVDNKDLVRLSPKDFCEQEENLQPFFDSILATQRQVSATMGAKTDGGAQP